ncbi:MAG TPA: carboxypeptidase-like regulatory domain-containing protein, partial [Chitinophagaceae bacterium]|nr:carboxypeptidase-like regulatory domain-containing protein [Chitinophagaceae bacterium]
MRKFLLVLIMGMVVHYAHAQNRTITGTVTSPTKTPLIGATVSIAGTNLATATNVNGVFTISVPASAKELEVSFIGYRNKTVPIGAENFIAIEMEEGTSSQLEEVVVGAGGISSRKKDQGYSTTKIGAEDLTRSKPTNIAAALTGKVAGLKINATNGGVNPSFRVVLRGQRSLTGNNQALVVLDNVVVP